MKKERVPRAAAHLFWCPFKGIDNIFVSLDVKVSLLIKTPWWPTSPKLIMLSLSGWPCVALIPPGCCAWGADMSTGSHCWELCKPEWKSGMLRARGEKEQHPCVGKKQNCRPRNHQASYGQIQCCKCLQVFVERTAGRFIRGGSENPCPKLSTSLMGCFQLSMVPASLAFLSHYRSRGSTSIWAQTPTLARADLICPFKPQECLCKACSAQR